MVSGVRSINLQFESDSFLKYLMWGGEGEKFWTKAGEQINLVKATHPCQEWVAFVRH